MAKLKPFKNSVFHTWIVSYITLLLVTLVISSAVYFVSSKSIEKNINDFNNTLLIQTRHNMDSMLQGLETLVAQASLNSNVNAVLHTSAEYDNTLKYTNTKILRDFRAYKSTCEFVYSFYVFIKNGNTVYTPESVFNAPTYFKVMDYKDNYGSYEEWYKFISDRHTREFIPITRKDTDGSEINTIAYVQSIQSLRTVVGNIVVILDENKTNEALKSFNWIDEGVALIIDKNNNVIASSHPVDLPDILKYENLSENQGFFTGNIIGEEAIASYITSNKSNWKYISVAPTKNFMKQLTNIRRLAVLVVLACLAAGAAMSYYFSRRNYIHISELVDILKENVRHSENDGVRENEFHFLKSAITNTLDEKRIVADKLEKHKNVLRQDLLRKLLKNTVSSHVSIEENCKVLGVNFNCEAFAVMIFIIEDSDQFFIEEDGGSYADRLLLARFITGNVVEELTNRTYKGYIIDMDEKVTCLINLHNEKNNKVKQDLFQIARDAKGFIQDNFEICFTISISSIHYTLAGIPKAYEEALEAIEYKMVYGSGEIIRYEDIKAPQQNYFYPLKVEHHLINCVKVGDYEAAKGILEMIFEKNFSDTCLSVQTAKCLMFDLVSTMIKTMSDINTMSSSTFFDDIHATGRLLKCETIFEMKDQMTSILQEVCSFIEDRKASHNTRLKDEIVSYIQNNYHDATLCVSSISEVFQMNPLYLSRFFKEQTAESLVDFINRVRLEQAKKLLKQQKINIDTVAEKVGYTNIVSFIRVFKKHEGITPGKYRELG